MTERSSTGPRRHSRVNWVGLRTLRQRPKVLGENKAGEPIVEVRSVRLVLRDGASHFSRVTTCSKCGREVPGAPVLSPADLDHPPHPVICKDCVRSAAAPVLTTARATATAPEVAADDGGHPPLDEDPVAVLERRVGELTKAVEAQQAVLERRIEDTRVELRSFAAKELARAQEDVDRMMKGVVERVGRAAAGTDAGGAQAVEAKLSRGLERLSQRVDDQRAELVADLDARLAQLQAAIDDRASPSASPVEDLPVSAKALEARLARLEDRLDAQVRELEERVAAGLAGAEALDGDREERASQRHRLEVLEAQVRELPATLGTEAARIEAQLTERLERLAAHPAPDHLEARLRDLQSAFEAEAARTAERVDERLAEDAPERQRLDALEARLGALEGGVEALTGQLAPVVDQRMAPVEESLGALGERLDRQAEEVDGRVAALEQRLEEAVDRLAALVESQRLEFQEEVRTGLAEARMAMAADQRGGGRLKKLEDAAAQQDARLAELIQLQTALDTGLGQLRSELEQVREAAARAADTERRLQATIEIPQLAVPEPELGRRGGRKAADALAGLTAAVQALVNDNRVIRAELATLENESETAVRASARASAQAGAIAPLRQDVRALRAEVVAQNEAVAALAKRVESLRKTLDPPPGAKVAKATKSTKPVKATRSTKKA